MQAWDMVPISVNLAGDWLYALPYTDFAHNIMLELVTSAVERKISQRYSSIIKAMTLYFIISFIAAVVMEASPIHNTSFFSFSSFFENVIRYDV